MNKSFSRVSAVTGTCVAALIAVLPPSGSAFAAGNDELWEVTTQMNVPGLPAGMGGMTNQVCRDKDPRKEAARDKDTRDCKITDLKQTATRLTMTMSCPRGKTVMDLTYNAAHTEYKGTLRMTGKDGEMTMNTAGRKIGSCDAAQARSEQAAKTAQLKADIERRQAEGNAQIKMSEDMQIQGCNEAVETMNVNKLGLYGQCRQQPELCNKMSSAKGGQRVATACRAKAAEFCKRYRTQQGFLKANASEDAAQSCGVSTQKLKASLCPGAARSQSLDFLGRFCPAEARPIAEVHCVGRGYTSKEGGKYADFCQNYLANADFEARSRTESAGRATSGGAESVQKEATDAATSEAINQGLNKLKGLFGR